MVLLEIQVLWDVMQCHWAGNKTDFLFYCLALKMNVVWSVKIVCTTHTDTVSHPRRVES